MELPLIIIITLLKTDLRSPLGLQVLQAYPGLKLTCKSDVLDLTKASGGRFGAVVGTVKGRNSGCSTFV